MLRFCGILAAGALCLALAEGARGRPAAPPAGSDLSPVLQKKKMNVRHYHLSNRLKGLSKGTHHVGNTKTGKQVHAHVHKGGKIHAISVGKTKHSKVHKVAKRPDSAERLASRRKAALPADALDLRTLAALEGDDAELTPTQFGPFAAFVIFFGGRVFVFFVPFALIAPTVVISPGLPPLITISADADTEVRLTPGQPGSLPAADPQAPGVAFLTPTWRRQRA
jgi:hypothetical protein